MDLYPPEKPRARKETLRRFLDDAVIPFERDAWDGPEPRPEYRESRRARAREPGIRMIGVPERYGGIGPAADLPIGKIGRGLRFFAITGVPGEILEMALARRVPQQYG